MNRCIHTHTHTHINTNAYTEDGTTALRATVQLFTAPKGPITRLRRTLKGVTGHVTTWHAAIDTFVLLGDMHTTHLHTQGNAWLRAYRAHKQDQGREHAQRLANASMQQGHAVPDCVDVQVWPVLGNHFLLLLYELFMCMCICACSSVN